MGEERRERRQARVEERVAALEALLGAMAAGATPALGPLLQIIEQIEQDMEAAGADLPGALGTVASTLADLGVDDDDLPGGLGGRAHTLRLALAISRELGKRLPLDALLRVVPGLPANFTEKGLMLPVALGLAAAYRARTDPDLLAKRVTRLRRKRDRLREA